MSAVQGAKTPARPLTRVVASRPWALGLFLACLALGASSVLVLPLNHDVSWILAIAQRVRGGARLYVDIIEVSPPLVVWLSMPVSAAADLLHVDAGDLFRGFVLALALGCIGIAAAILRARLDGTTGLVLLFALCYATVPAPGYDFGQREHLALLLSLPYLAMAVLRLQGGESKCLWRSAAALLAAVGFCLKPYFMLVPVMVEGWILLRTRSRPDGSGYVIAGFAVLYLAAIVLLAPEYLPLARMLSKVYGVGYLGISPFSFLGEGNFLTGIICVAMAFLVRPQPAAMSQVGIAAAIGFAGSALVQTKGWSYHWYPFAALGWPLLALAVTTVVSRRRRADAALRLIPFAAVVLCAAALVSAPARGRMQNPNPAVLEPVIRELGGGPVMIFSNRARVSFPLVTLPGVGNPSRLPLVSVLSAAINTQQREVEKYLRDIVVQDVLRYRPRLLIIEKHPDGMPPEFDFVEYLSSEPALARELGSYREVRSLTSFRLYQRVAPPLAAPVAPP